MYVASASFRFFCVAAAFPTAVNRSLSPLARVLLRLKRAHLRQSSATLSCVSDTPGQLTKGISMTRQAAAGAPRDGNTLLARQNKPVTSPVPARHARQIRAALTALAAADRARTGGATDHRMAVSGRS